MSPRAAGRTTALFLLLMIVGQALWMRVVPPFGQMDEFDHAYRVASVARGDIVARAVPDSGYGDLISVPADLVEAAYARCSHLKYTAAANCTAQSAPDANGNVQVASSAARYFPVWYAVVGTAARPFHGADALEAMRLAGALLCDLVLAICVWISCRVGRTRWPLVGVLVSATPILVCATAAVAPNGLELSAGLLLWTAGLALYRGPSQAISDRRLIQIVASAVAIMVVAHSTGALWAALDLAALAILMGRARVAAVLRSLGRSLWLWISGVGAITLAVAWWSVSQRTNDPTMGTHNFHASTGMILGQVPLWLFQTIGSIPFRNQPAPPQAFAIGLLGYLALTVLGYAVASRRARAVAALVTVAFFAIPLVLTLMSYSKIGFAWQGRYALPLGYGVLLIAAWSLDKHAGNHAVHRFAAPVAVVSFLGMNLYAVFGVFTTYELPKWTAGDAVRPPSWPLLIALAVVWGATGLALIRAVWVPAEVAAPVARVLEPAA